MKRGASILSIAVLAFLAGYRWGGGHGDHAVALANSTPPVLFYRCPMHPRVTSQKPGLAPCCHMKLEPVYAGSAAAAAGPAGSDVPPGTAYVSPAQQELIGMQFSTVSYETLSHSVHGAAHVGFNENRIARVQTKMDGWVDQIFVTAVGASVRKGQQLMTIYNPKAAIAQRDYVRALKDAPMAQPTVDGGRAETPPANLDGLISAGRLRLELLGFSDAQMDALEMARQPFVRIPVLAPITGVVIERSALPRQRITPEALYTIADLSTVWVTAEIFDYDAALLQPGAAATLTIPAISGKYWMGTVDAVLPQADPATRALQVRLSFPNPDSLLKPEMYGSVEIHLSGSRRALTVPAEAILDSGASQRVFVDSGQGYLQPREVHVGQRFGDRLEITRGLKAGDKIVTAGNFLVDSESRLNPVAGTGSRDRKDH